MLNKVLETSRLVVANAKHVKINYEKTNDLVKELLSFENIHYLAKLPYDIYSMSTKDIVNFLLIYDSINYSFWGNPKWTIQIDGDTNLDGSIALLHCLFNIFKENDSINVYKHIETMTFSEFERILEGNVKIPLIKERYQTIIEISKIVNSKMGGNFYEYIKNITTAQELFKIIIENFSSFDDSRIYQCQTIHFYKLAQLLTSDILHVISNKENIEVDYSELIGCADYKIPQVMEHLGILEYDETLSSKLENQEEILENSEYEIEIRASMLVVINYLWEQTNGKVDRIDINDFIWGKGQDKTKKLKPYHLTRTKSY